MDRTNEVTPASILKDIFAEIHHDDVQVENQMKLLKVRKNFKPEQIKITEDFKISGLKPENK